MCRWAQHPAQLSVDGPAGRSPRDGRAKDRFILRSAQRQRLATTSCLLRDEPWRRHLYQTDGHPHLPRLERATHYLPAKRHFNGVVSRCKLSSNEIHSIERLRRDAGCEAADRVAMNERRSNEDGAALLLAL